MNLNPFYWHHKELNILEEWCAESEWHNWVAAFVFFVIIVACISIAENIRHWWKRRSKNGN